MHRGFGNKTSWAWLVLLAALLATVGFAGCGAVIAVAALALAQGLPVDRIAALSNLAGGLVCEEVGVVPIDLDRFRREAEAAAILP